MPPKKKAVVKETGGGLNAAIKAINDKYGDGIRMGDTFDNPDRISSGSLAMDVATGGGFPKGRVTRLYGDYSTGKTLTALNTAREAQKMGMSVCYWDVEKTFSPKFAGEKIGIDVGKNFWVNNLTVIEDIAAAMELLLPEIDFHILDSTSSAQAEDLLNAAPNAWLPGIQARSWGRAFDRINKIFDKERNTLILIDQVRINFKSGAEQAAGGKVLDHVSSTSVMFKKGSWLNRNDDGFLDVKAKNKVDKVSETQQPEGRLIKARVEKSKVSDPLRPAVMMMDFSAANYDKTFEYLEEAKRTGVIESRGGGNYYYPHADSLKEGQKQKHMRGEPALRDFVSTNKILQSVIRKKAIELAESR
jgi:recombination protein RecA